MKSARVKNNPSPAREPLHPLAPAVPLSPRRRKLTLAVIVSMTFMATLDSSIVNVALPVMSKEMQVPVSAIEWVVVGYSIMVCAMLLFFGRLGDLAGKSRVFRAGSVVFTVASLLCGLCSSFYPLIACRMLQGLGAAAFMATNQGMVTELYPGRGRGKAMGVLSASVAMGTLVGPAMGGLLLSAFPWNSIFWVNVPVGIAVYFAAVRLLPQGKRKSEPMDWKGAVLQFLATILFFGALIEAQRRSFSNPGVLSAILLSLVLGFWFLHGERGEKNALLNLWLLRNSEFSVGLLCAGISFVCISASTILLPFYLENALRLSPGETGIFMMITPMTLGIFGPLSGSLSDRFGSEFITMIGLVIMSFGFFLMSHLNEFSSGVVAGVFVGVMSVGQSLFQPANNSLVMSSGPKGKFGIMGSLNALVRNMGLVAGLTFSTSLLYFFMSLKLGTPVSDYVQGRDDVFTYGMQRVYLLLVLLCGTGALITAARFFRSRRRKRRQ